jgi:hypothetical protein
VAGDLIELRVGQRLAITEPAERGTVVGNIADERLDLLAVGLCEGTLTGRPENDPVPITDFIAQVEADHLAGLAACAESYERRERGLDADDVVVVK